MQKQYCSIIIVMIRNVTEFGSIIKRQDAQEEREEREGIILYERPF